MCDFFVWDVCDFHFVFVCAPVGEWEVCVVVDEVGDDGAVCCVDHDVGVGVGFEGGDHVVVDGDRVWVEGEVGVL